MTTKQDKKPVPFIKAGDFFMKKQKSIYVMTSDPKNVEYSRLINICDDVAFSLIIRKIQKSNNLTGSYFTWPAKYKIRLEDRINKLKKRLEREFLRKEEKEKQYHDKYEGVIELIYIESSDIEDIFNESVFFNGQINIKKINHLIYCFNSDKERLDNIFKSEYGTYYFGVIENAIADKYEFELIDFKPLENS